MPVPVRVARAFYVCLACVWLLPLLSLLHAAHPSRVYAAVLVALIGLAAWRPAAGLVVFGVVTPLTFALIPLATVRLAAPQAVEGMVLSWLAGAAVHRIRWPAEGLPSRLTLPALSFGVVLAAGAAWAALGQFDGPAETAREVWRYVTGTYLIGPPTISGLQLSLRWMEVVALAAGVERAIRAAPAWSPLIVAGWLAASAGAAAQSAVRILEATLRSGDGLASAVDVVRAARVSGVYPDVNAAGSIFALVLVTAIVFGVARRRWLFTGVVALVTLVGLLATQSRAAEIAVAVVLGAGAAWRLVRAGRRTLAVALGVVVVTMAIGVLTVKDRTHVSAGAAVASRFEMSRIALKIARANPVFGAGAGRFQSTSLDYIDAKLIASFPEAAVGENAHNNFLQVLAEFGLVGFTAFVWLLGAACRPAGTTAGTDRAAILSGLAAFLISALFGHPLLIFEIAVAFFLALGLAAGLSPSPPGQVRRWPVALAAALAVASVVRVGAALIPTEPAIVGATAVLGELDGQPFRAADWESRWRLRPRARAAAFPMRWDAAHDRDCRVVILIDGRQVDEVTLTADAWVPIFMVIPPEARPSLTQPTVELRVSARTCRLLVGPVRAWR